MPAVNSYRMNEKLKLRACTDAEYDEIRKHISAPIRTPPFFVPNVQNEEQLRITGMMIEAMSAEGYKRIVPAYYEVALKVKYSQDDESVQMIEIINDASRPSFSWCLENWQGLQMSLYTLIFGSSSDYASYYAKTVKPAKARIKYVVKCYEKLGVN